MLRSANRSLSRDNLLYSIFLVLLNLLASMPVLAQADNQLAPEQKKPNLTVSMRQFNQPYVFSDGTGILADLISKALPDYSITTVFAPYERGAVMLAAKEIDAISIVPPSGVSIEGAFISEPYIEFHNQLVILDDDKYKSIQFSDLATLEIMAFANARIFLGAEFSEMVSKNPRYREIQDQEMQARTLMFGRVEAIITEQNIFWYHLNKLIANDQASDSAKIRMVDFFPPTPYCIAFNNEQLRNDFNKNIKALKESGEYKKIVEKYSPPVNRSGNK